MILSPIMSFVVDKELGFPIPSEKEKINKALRRYRYLLSQHPNRSDSPEIMFGIADLLVGRNNPGDYAEAGKILDQILMRPVPDYLKSRALVGKAELMIGQSEECDNAISMCERARKLLGKDVAEFFAAKTFVVEVELLLARGQKNDWKNAIKLADRVIKNKHVHWYFRGRAFLSKAEITLYRQPKKLNQALKLVNLSLYELRNRQDDYFTNKGKLLKGEIMIRRLFKGDLEKAEAVLVEVIKMPIKYNDLIARAKIALADITLHPKASKLIKEVMEIDGLDPYLAEKAQQIEQALIEKKKAPRQARGTKKSK
ncbi:MAG: hypothetical protein ABIE84_01120 [bacterium]